MRRSVITFGLFCLVLALGCGGSGSSGPSNSITIENVASIIAIDGAATFTVKVSYDLQTAQSGKVHLSWCDSSFFGDRFDGLWAGCPTSINYQTANEGQGTIVMTNTTTFTGTRYLRMTLVPDQESASTAGVVSDEQEISLP